MIKEECFQETARKKFDRIASPEGGLRGLWIGKCLAVYPSQHKPQSLQLHLSGSRITQETSIHRERVRSDVHGHLRSLPSTSQKGAQQLRGGRYLS